MAKIIYLSEAASIAIHGMIHIAQSDKPVNVRHIAEINNSSRHHAAKVFQQLVKAELVRSSRGPSGGFVLNRRPEEISLLEIFEVIEGKITFDRCPHNKTICPYDVCIFNNKIKDLTLEFKDFLKNRKLSYYLELVA